MAQIDKEYATALFTLALENNAVDEYASALKEIWAVFEENPDYERVLESPALPLSERIACIDEAFSESYTEHLVAFLKILCEKGHIKALEGCVSEFNELLRIHKNRTVATVYYVEPLTEEQKHSLTEKLSSISGKNIEAVYVKDESLIGGIKVQLDDKILDGSLKHRITKTKGVIS